MKGVKLFAIIAILTAAAQANADAIGAPIPLVPGARSASAGNFRFVCPESAQTQTQLAQQYADFGKWVAQVHPELNTITKIVTFRMALLEEHHCAATLATIHEEAKASGTSDQMPQPSPASQTQADPYAAMQARGRLNTFCNARHAIAVEAKSYKAIGWSLEATEEQLVREFAYGPGGQVFLGSAGTEAMVLGVTAAVYYPTPHLNDSYGTQDGYMTCLSGH